MREYSKSYCDDMNPLIPQLFTYEIPVFTGVFDSTGSPIYRNKNPVGFGRNDEWREPRNVIKDY